MKKKHILIICLSFFFLSSCCKEEPELNWKPQFPPSEKGKKLEKKLLETKWKLKAGSTIYDPGFSDQDPKLEYKKLITFHFAKEHKFHFRYSYPMGIVSTKTNLWYIEGDNTLTYRKKGSSHGEDQIFFWEILSIENNQLEMQEKESKEKRIFVKTTDIEDVDKDDYKIIKN